MAKNVTKKTVTRRRDRKNIEKGSAHIHSSFNNTIVTITDVKGNVISWASAGGLGFKGSRKSTPFAAGEVAETAAKKAMEHGLKTVDVLIDGRFILEEKSLNVAFRGSKNQRIIDVQKSLKENKVCTIKKYDIKEPLVLNMREQYLFI